MSRNNTASGDIPASAASHATCRRSMMAPRLNTPVSGSRCALWEAWSRSCRTCRVLSAKPTVMITAAHAMLAGNPYSSHAGSGNPAINCTTRVTVSASSGTHDSRKNPACRLPCRHASQLDDSASTVLMISRKLTVLGNQSSGRNHGIHTIAASARNGQRNAPIHCARRGVYARNAANSRMNQIENAAASAAMLWPV